MKRLLYRISNVQKGTCLTRKASLTLFVNGLAAWRSAQDHIYIFPFGVTQAYNRIRTESQAKDCLAPSFWFTLTEPTATINHNYITLTWKSRL